MSGSDYPFEEVEARWLQRWADDRLFELDLDAVPPDQKFYSLVEFPYPSAEGLHVGHVYTYCGADSYGRYLRMRHRKVFQPIGFDSFGIHTENFALRVGERPDRLTGRTIDNYRRQLRRLGAAWSWDQEIVTSDPSYYRWTQWIFLKLFQAGLAVRKEAPVVWCPSCLTVLANEQVEDDRCERCRTLVTTRVMEQWFLRITAYADRLVDGLDDLDWPEISKRLQREWIGRSMGVEIEFPLHDSGDTLTVFTTRPDTLFGITFLAVSPDHPAANIAGRRAVNPATREPVPILVADYVQATYGTGVVMGVPAHDARDHDFAGRMGLPIRRVIESPQAPAEGAWDGEGRLVDSGPFTGLESSTAREEIADWLEQKGYGHRATRYRLHDWLISRQRYWGPPIPIVYCARCGTVPVPEEQLPVLLPELENFRPTGTGQSPLASVPEFVQTVCPRCGRPARRETDVSDTFLDSAWYFLRYPSADSHDRAWDPDRTKRWLPVDMYAGGREHVMRHHLYARFITMALYDLGLVPFAEPFPHLRLHGLLVYEGAKMSKSRGNVVNPDEYIAQVGADSLRMYLLFCGPWEEGGDFSDASLAGVVRFTSRIWKLLQAEGKPGDGSADMSELDRTTARIQEAIDRSRFNTAIARLMELVRWLDRERPHLSATQWKRATRTATLLLAPFAPHLAEELWQRVGGPYSVHSQEWPSYDPAALTAQEVEIVVQVNGRLRGRFQGRFELTKEEALESALALPEVTRHLDEKLPRQVFYVPGRLLNLVVKAARHSPKEPDQTEP
ncbi:MAG: leucine--tRNA ligase [Candidatus Dormibacteraeota bacterium]|nr:leucine--tRNA ligase [Candidatus Dormibacteraeota bacterium]